MDLLTPEQVAQIMEAAAAAGSEPREVLRNFGERLRDLRNENPHASEANLKEAVKGAVQAMIAKSRGQRRRADTHAQDDPPGHPWTSLRQNAVGSGVRGRADAQLHHLHRVQPA